MGSQVNYIDNLGHENESGSGLFAIRGSLDGAIERDHSEKEQFIGLKIGGEVFFLAISVVSEIIMLPPITYVPQAARFIEGVINLRGTILPAINLRKMMGIERAAITSGARIIVIRYDNMPAGLIVDGITFVVSLLPTEIETQSLPGKGTGTDLIDRIGKYEDKIIAILDLPKIVSTAAEGRLTDDEESDQE
jgi:purine-binding chemotaxis protein CheW